MDLTASISREITYKHDTHLKRHLQVSENPHWVTTALHEWPVKVQRKITPPKKGKCCSVFFQQLKHLHICLPHFLLWSGDEYEKEMSVLSIISFHRQFGQLNSNLIIITKEQQEDKSTQIRFYCGANAPRGSVPSTHGLAGPGAQAVLFSRMWLCESYNLCHPPKDNTRCHTPNVHSAARAGTGKGELQGGDEYQQKVNIYRSVFTRI